MERGPGWSPGAGGWHFQLRLPLLVLPRVTSFFHRELRTIQRRELTSGGKFQGPEKCFQKHNWASSTKPSSPFFSGVTLLRGGADTLDEGSTFISQRLVSMARKEPREASDSGRLQLRADLRRWGEIQVEPTLGWTSCTFLGPRRLSDSNEDGGLSEQLEGDAGSGALVPST